MKIITGILILFSSMLFNASPSMEIYIYNNGASEKVDISNAKEKKIEPMIKDIYEKADQTLRVYVSKEDLQKIKNKDRCVEIIFDGGYSLNNPTIGNAVVHKMLIPLTGNYAGSESSGNVIFFVGQNDYDGTPYANSQGFKYIKGIYRVLLGSD